MKNNLYQKGFIVPVLLGAIALLMIGGGLYSYNTYKNKWRESPPLPFSEKEITVDDNGKIIEESDIKINSDSINIKTFRLGTLEFSYPSNLSYTTSGGGPLISLNHSIPFKHVNSCDLKDGLSIDYAADFSTSFKLNSTNIINSIKNDNPNGYTDLIKNSVVSVQPGFVDKYKIGSLDGYKISIGAEGCGYSTYYFPISANETLVIRKDVYLQTLQMGRDSLKNISGFISQTEEEQIFKDILSSITGIENQKTMSIKVYFSNKIFNPEMFDCSLVYPVTRVIPYTQQVATASINELLKGVTAEESKSGYVSVMPEGTKLNSIKIENGVAYVDFNENIGHGFASCSGATRLNAANKTLLQFPTISSVGFSVNGDKDSDALQP